MDPGTARRALIAPPRIWRAPHPDDLTFPDRPRWRRATIVDWLDNRPGKGARTDLKSKQPGFPSS